MSSDSSTGLQLDVFVQGEGVRRGLSVAVTDDALICGDITIPFEEVFWLTRRAGLLLVLGRNQSVALRGSRPQLDQVMRSLEARVDQTAIRRRIVQELGHEVVLFSAGCAAAGTLRDESVRGLCVAAATRRGIHLFTGEEHFVVSWPVREARRKEAAQPGSGDMLELEGEQLRLVLRYLFPEEIGAVLTVATVEPEAAGKEGPLELFSRSEVAPPTQAELPEFSLAAGSLQEVAERAAANVPGELRTRALLAPHFFELHFLELGEIALGPLLLRKSAASSAGSLERAIRAMNAAGLQEDTRAAVTTAADRLVGAYHTELTRIAAQKKAPSRMERELSFSGLMRRELAARMQAPFDELWSRFEELAAQEESLAARLAHFDASPPDEETEALDEAAAEWRATLARLDRGYEAAWREMLEEIERTWSAVLLSRLARVGAVQRSRMPEWIQLSILAVITLILVAVVVYLVVG